MRRIIPFKAVTYTAPAYWAPYYINGDASYLDDNEQNQADLFLELVGLGSPVGCEDVGFMHNTDAYRMVSALAGEACEYTFFQKVGK